jgi:hypothetical protein
MVLPFGLVRGVRGLRQLLRGRRQTRLGLLDVLLEELDASVDQGDLALGLKRFKKREDHRLRRDAAERSPLPVA